MTDINEKMVSIGQDRICVVLRTNEEINFKSISSLMEGMDNLNFRIMPFNFVNIISSTNTTSDNILKLELKLNEPATDVPRVFQKHRKMKKINQKQFRSNLHYQKGMPFFQ